MSYTGKRKERPCPRCSPTNTVPIQYGLPTAEAGKAADRGEIMLGGCCIDRDSPKWHCKDCEHEWSEGRTQGNAVSRNGLED